MGKRIKLLGVVLLAMATFAGCKKAEEGIVDCLSESIKTGVHVTVSAGNAKQVSTEVTYWGHKTITSVKWEFGDGTTATTTGLSSSHTYTTAGNYTVKARVTFTEGKSSCEVDPTKAVTIQ